MNGILWMLVMSEPFKGLDYSDHEPSQRTNYSNLLTRSVADLGNSVRLG